MNEYIWRTDRPGLVIPGEDLAAMILAMNLASAGCPHDDADGAHYSTADQRFRCPPCLAADPPPPHQTCDRCHTGPPDQRCVLTIDGCDISLALCQTCVTLIANNSQQDTEDTP